MDPPYGAYNRIWLFLADLNLVLGCLPAPTPYRPVARNSFVSPQNLHWSSLDFCSQLSRKHPTQRSQAWKKAHSTFGREQLGKAGTTSNSCPVHFLTHWSAHVYTCHKHRRPHRSSQKTGQSWSTNQHQSLTPCEQAVKYVVYPYKQDQRLLEDSQGERYTAEHLDHEELSALEILQSIQKTAK
ncbi:hypothetical protein PGT21_036716 [Puccinia graminis f. sp. tritici]|uniref:Uncharacterized protein n=1 Tax=Puccinia graminis f. sp. tritici TaxID=56615 RepID=A0A5B0P0Y1_PUCGR|nr:hypothetical protein PGT21_036716 [Puccinia graminis f. sp. tritici]KAA1121495.1 hypothetical protein PGTUg99_029509 [Puccinia graminis f. sp. tritici]